MADGSFENLIVQEFQDWIAIPGARHTLNLPLIGELRDAMSLRKRIFLSYGTDDRYRAADIVKALRAAGHPTFWDQDLLPRANFRSVLANEIRRADFTIVLWSRSSVNSTFVADEANLAKRVGNYTPAMLDKVQPPLGLRGHQFLWLDQWDGDTRAAAWRLLLATVEGEKLMHDGAPLPFDSFSDGVDAPTMIPLQICEATPQSAVVRRLAISAYFVTHAQSEGMGVTDPPLQSPLLEHPFADCINFTYREAREFCERLTKASGRAYRLPTTVEYEAIARSLTHPGTAVTVSPLDSVQSLRAFTRGMWTWVEGARSKKIGDVAFEVAEACGGCWLTPATETFPRALFTTMSRTPFVGLRVVADI